MDKEEKEESASSALPVLPRMDRLDRLLQLLEEKQSLSGRRLFKTAVRKAEAEEEEDDHCKTLSSALDEVQTKGTLMERLAMLENRVFKLSLEMDEGNTSKSSSSTVPGSEKLDHGFESSTGDSKQEKDEIMKFQGMQSPPSVENQECTKTCDVEKKGDNTSRRKSKKAYKKWLRWLPMGC